MNPLAKLRDGYHRFLDAPGALRGFLRRWGAIGSFCWRRMGTNNDAAMSAALSFSTLFAMIPALVLAALLLQSMGLLGTSEDIIRRVLAAGGLPQIVVGVDRDESATRPGEPAPPPGEAATHPARHHREFNLAEQIYGMVHRVERQITLGRVGPIGVLLLFWSAVALMTTIEKSLNRIFMVRRSRPLLRRVMLYWAALTLLPLLLAAALYSVRSLHGLEALPPPLPQLLDGAGSLVSALVSILLLALLYKLMPNTPVSFRHAFRGALVAVPLWLAAKWGFSLYVSEIVAKGSIYGALGLLPLFLLWLNLSWMIFLLGGEITFAVQNLRRLQEQEEAASVVLGPYDLLGAMLVLAQRFEAGAGPVDVADLQKQIVLPDLSIVDLMERLAAVGLVCSANGGETYLICRPPEHIRVADILALAGPGGPAARNRFDAPVAQIAARVEQAAHETIKDLTLANVMGK